MANLKVAVVRYEHTPIALGAGGMTIGRMVDERIMDAMNKDEMLQEVTVFLEEIDWHELRNPSKPTKGR